MEPTREPLTMYGQRSELAPLEWSWADERLSSAPVYWVDVAVSPEPDAEPSAPHARPVWGVWVDQQLYLSVGSPRLAAGFGDGVPVTAHLGGDVEVVILEGFAAGRADEARLIEAYNRKYDWDYIVAEYGALVRVRPSKVIAWQSAGFAGRDGFQAAARWRFTAGEGP